MKSGKKIFYPKVSDLDVFADDVLGNFRKQNRYLCSFLTVLERQKFSLFFDDFA